MKRHSIIITGILCSFLTGVLATTVNGASLRGDSLPPSSLDFRELIPKEFEEAWKFKLDDWIVWGADMIRTDDGICHLFFSYWPKKKGFHGWLTDSRIGYATSENPEGPYSYQGVALSYQQGTAWDWMSHNPSVIEYDGKFYLYYTGTNGRGDYRMNMRVGVAVADHPSGPWKRFDKPLLDTGDYGEGIVATPCAMVSPDGSIFLYFKTQSNAMGRFGKFGDGVMHYASTSKNPLGPFKKYSKPMMDKADYFPGRHFQFHIDDHEEWFQKDRYYAIVKDHNAPFLTEFGQILHLMESTNGLDWVRSANSFVKDKKIQWANGPETQYQRLEMPKIYLENGQPRVLFLAALEKGDRSGHSYNIAIPLSPSQDRED